jgi:G:T/U-mismatch repair DNA glycosylase
MSFLIAGAIIVGAGVAKHISGKKAQKAAEKKAEEAKAEMDRRKAEYSKLDTSNPYADYQNQMAENVYEDITVNQQQAQFQKEQQEQQRANIMQNLQGAAGGSGIAALAQQMANQGSLDARQSAASIGQQEVANQKLQAQGALIVQKGEQAAMGKRVEGEIMSRDMERNKIMTLMGMSQSEMAAHRQNAAAAQAQATEAWGDIAGGVGSLVSNPNVGAP